MKSYELTQDAEKDLREVARYTLNKWSKEKLKEYRGGLKDTFEQIGKKEIRRRPFSEKFPGLLVAKYKYHVTTHPVKKSLTTFLLHKIAPTRFSL